MADEPLRAALIFQARACASFGSTFYSALLEATADRLEPEIRRLFSPWDGRSETQLIAEAVALRFLGGLHDIVLGGADEELAGVFPPAGRGGALALPAVLGAVRRHGERLARFMAHEPQTNEVRRSACLLPGFLLVAQETGLPLRCLELGASAGLNQLWSRFRYELSGAGVWGDAASPVVLEADWRGPPPPLDERPTIRGVAACDRAPLDVRDPAQRRRLAAYVWPDQPERLARLEAAARMAVAAGVTVEPVDAADWVRARAAPRQGEATVIYHSIVWQYLPPQSARALEDAIVAHGGAAGPDRPLAWLRMEPAGRANIELSLTTWPGGRERLLARVHAHGAWIEWIGSA